MSNETNLHRAARALQAQSALSYQQARDLLVRAGKIPDLSTSAAVAAFLDAPNRTAAPRFTVVIDDRIGHTEDVFDVGDLPPALRAFIQSRPPVRLRWETPDAVWDVTPLGVAELSTVRVEWADADMRFAVRGFVVNPGCDDCGILDAVVRIDGRYLCVSGAADAGLDVPADLSSLRICDECEQTIRGAELVCSDHAADCSLHPGNVA